MTKRYTQEFREEAVRLVLSGQISQEQISRDLGVSTWTLRDWVKKHNGKTDEARPPKVETLEEENRRLRRENERLKMERDILKKAAAYFAKEQL